MLAPYWLWSAEHLAVKEVTDRLHAIKDSVDQKQKKLNIRLGVSALLEEGRLLMIRCGDESQPPPEEEANQWATKAELYLQQNLDDSFVGRFRSSADLPMTANSIQSVPHRNLWAGIRSRNAKLEQFIKNKSKSIPLG